MTYGMLASQSCLLTNIFDQLHENSKKVNSVERLTRHLNKGIPKDAQKSYLTFVRTMVSSNPIIHIDDSDVIKPEGRKFEALGLVRDGSKSTNTKTVYEKGYHVTEACVLTGNNHPVSIFSRIHSSKEKNYTSTNDVTFSAMERGASLFGKATFVMDRDIFLTLRKYLWLKRTLTILRDIYLKFTIFTADSLDFIPLR